MKEKKILGVPILLWLFPPVAMTILVLNAVRGEVSEGGMKGDEDKRDG